MRKTDGSSILQNISGKTGAVYSIIGVNTAKYIGSAYKLKGKFHSLTALSGRKIHCFTVFFYKGSFS